MDNQTAVSQLGRIDQRTYAASAIFQVLETKAEVVPTSPETVERALDRIMQAVDPFEQAAREELERFRETFADLAK